MPIYLNKPINDEPSTDLVIAPARHDQILQIPEGVKFWPSSLEIPELTEWQQWVDLGIYLARAKKSATYWIKQHREFGENSYDDDQVDAGLAQMDLGFDDQVEQDRLSKLKTFPHPNLTVEHHFIAAKLGKTEADQEKWLKTADSNHLTPHELKKSMLADRIIRIDAGPKPRTGVASPHAIRQQFIFWQQQIGDTWQTASIDSLSQAIDILEPIETFIGQLRRHLSDRIHAATLLKKDAARAKKSTSAV